MDEGYFVDWISCSQYHGETASEVVGSLHFKMDADGAPDVETGGSLQVKGSHSTSVQIRSHAGWVTFSGNPGRFGRPDNLYGFDLDECMQRVNDILSGYDLPGFSAGEQMRADEGEITEGKLPHWTGCRFSRVDITRGFEAGSEFAARLAMRAYQRMSVARTTKSVWGGETAIWKTQRRTVKAYLKGPEMRAHGLGDSPWTEHATQRGVVRHEVELRSKYLSETRLRYWGNLTMGELIRIHLQETDHLREPDVGHDPLAVESLPSRVRLTYASWLKGENVRELLSRATFYRHRSALLELAGVDIQDTRDVGQFVEPRIKHVELRPSVAPAEYWRLAA